MSIVVLGTHFYLCQSRASLTDVVTELELDSKCKRAWGLISQVCNVKANVETSPM